MRAEVNQSLDFESDASLRATLKIPIIEDAARLDGVTWKQARTRYNEWVWDYLKQKPGFNPLWDISKIEEKVGHMITRSPHLEFFIFADQASVDSVVDCTTLDAPGAYFFTLVATGLRTTRIFSVDDDLNIMKDDEEREEAKFRLYDFVRVYASIVSNTWPEYMREEDGISYP